MIDLDYLQQALDKQENERLFSQRQIIFKAARAYLACQSKPADGVEGDLIAELEAVNYEMGFDDGKLIPVSGDQIERRESARNTIRHALQSTAKLRGDSVPMPQNEDQAAMMQLLGFKWLEDNAPHRLRPEIVKLRAQVAFAEQKLRRAMQLLTNRGFDTEGIEMFDAAERLASLGE